MDVYRIMYNVQCTSNKSKIAAIKIYTKKLLNHHIHLNWKVIQSYIYMYVVLNMLLLKRGIGKNQQQKLLMYKSNKHIYREASTILLYIEQVLYILYIYSLYTWILQHRVDISVMKRELQEWDREWYIEHGGELRWRMERTRMRDKAREREREIKRGRER